MEVGENIDLTNHFKNEDQLNLYNQTYGPLTIDGD